MSGIKVVEMNEAGGQEVEQNEGATQETQPPEQEIEPIEEEPPNISNEITQDEEEEEEVKPKKKEKALDKKVQCKKCDKEMTLKTYRYTHEKKCNGKLEEKPVKPQAKPKPKAMPTPRIALQTKPVTTKAPPPEPIVQQRNPVYDIREHYQILQNEYIKHKQEKYSNLCQNMFNSKAKKRQ